MFIAAPQMVHAGGAAAARWTSPFTPRTGETWSTCGTAAGRSRCCSLPTGSATAPTTCPAGASPRTPNWRPAIGEAIPGARLGLRDGRGTGWLGRDIYLDISRLREDTGFQPGYDTTAAVADYIGWLRSGNER